jgi:hypothetical protein
MKQYNSRDVLAFELITKKYNNDYDELYDSLYNYMKSYIEGYTFDTSLFRDEIENLIGIRKHEEIIKYIIDGGEG